MKVSAPGVAGGLARNEPSQAYLKRVYRIGREDSRKHLRANQGNAKRPFIIRKVTHGHEQNTPSYIILN